MNEYKPIKWYKSEFAWLLISLLWQLFFAILLGQNLLPEYFIWIFLIGTAYSTYFVLKGIIYAWIINPIHWYKRQFKKIKNFFTKK